MLKQSHINNYQDHHLNLYDKVRQDLFEEDQKPKELRAPSITTIFLLQIQAYIVQLLLQLPPIHHNNNNANNALSSQRSSALFFVVIYQQKRLHVITSIRSIIRQCLRWILLVGLLILDNIARVLNVEGEMYEITNKQQKEEKKPIHNNGFEEEEYQVHDDEDFVRSSTDTYRDDYYLQKKSSFNHGHSDQCTTTNNNKRNTNGIPSEPSSPTHPKKLNGGGNYSPSHSPTPNFIRNSSRPTSAVIQQKEFSPNLNPSRVNNRTRSLSNNLDQYTATKQQKLRRITGQREITLQNAILPIPSRNSHQNGKPPLGNIVKKASSVASRSSSESISGGGVVRPKMLKTQSLSTAQQYHSHNHNHHHHHHHNESFKLDLRSPMMMDTKKPYERCCPACAST